ncbi:hypothetical protein G9U52_17470 [Paenibacillus sp. S3N08]|uniref:Uncharacterized protein n=1 Tax=Paenibacillus agricola TaxID=2716264 RepID=A0ABX0J5L6_9BACL|nr:hypothetical protein [Paenibacillus agricola]
MEGTSDSEIGFWQYKSLLQAGEQGISAISKVHETLGGVANIGVLREDGEFLIYAAHPENRVYTFGLGKLKMVSTALHSHDDFLFQAIFPEARSIELLPLHTVLTL